jgi:hypothetical protein
MSHIMPTELIQPPWPTLIVATITAALGAAGAWLASHRPGSRELALVNELQEELQRFREATDSRLDKLEFENAAYRKFVWAYIDYVSSEGLKPLPWPTELPR